MAGNTTTGSYSGFTMAPVYGTKPSPTLGKPAINQPSTMLDPAAGGVPGLPPTTSGPIAAPSRDRLTEAVMGAQAKPPAAISDISRSQIMWPFKAPGGVIPIGSQAQQDAASTDFATMALDRTGQRDNGQFNPWFKRYNY